ncbi:hypothetical protein LUW77_08345 [Streptomyces radiopugnans]|nr:hypothetical protein LUW77_08345 [Streptomyces radiopugnans]
MESVVRALVVYLFILLLLRARREAVAVQHQHLRPGPAADHQRGHPAGTAG